MEKHSMKIFWDFSQYVYNQFGMCIAIFAAYRNGEGDPVLRVNDLYCST
jgi:hypothetical protein